MSHNIAVLLLGTNIGDKEKNLSIAKKQLKELGLNIINETLILETDAVEFTSKNYFLNQIITVEITVSPIELLKGIKEIEQNMGRIYATPLLNEKYTDRLIDIDILKIDNITYKSKQLEIPHPRNFNRKFVLDLIGML